MERTTVTSFCLVGIFCTMITLTKCGLVWIAEINQNVTFYQSTTSAVSSIKCVMECMKNSQCDSCAYDKKSGTCYLQVQSVTATDVRGNSVTRYTARCRFSDAPINHTTMTASWTWTEGVVEGQVNCSDDDYLYVGDQPALACTERGPWLKKAGECKQRIWRTETVHYEKYPLPMTIVPGWSFCFEGIPTNDTRVFFELHDDSNNILVHLDCRKNALNSLNRLVLASRIDNVWGSNQAITVDPGFPLVAGVKMVVKIVAITLTDIEVYIDGTRYMQHNPPVSLDQVRYGLVTGDVDVEVLNLWCDL